MALEKSWVLILGINITMILKYKQTDEFWLMHSHMMHSCSTAPKENKNLSHSLLPEPRYAFIIIATTTMLSSCTVGNAGLVILRWQNKLIWARTYICHWALSLSVPNRNWAIAWFTLWTDQAEVWTATIVISTWIWVRQLSQRVVYVYVIWTMCCVSDYFQVIACWYTIKTLRSTTVSMCTSPT